MAENRILEEILAAFLALADSFIVFPVQLLVDGAVHALHYEPLLEYRMGGGEGDEDNPVGVDQQAEVMPLAPVRVHPVEGGVVALRHAPVRFAEVNALLYRGDEYRRRGRTMLNQLCSGLRRAATHLSRLTSEKIINR